jgi:hypothetical protein
MHARHTASLISSMMMRVPHVATRDGFLDEGGA